jgi:hypothetical protein
VISPAELYNAAPLAVWLVVDALACYRLTRVLLLDTLPPLPRLRHAWRAWWGNRAPRELAECPWCLSPYVGAGVLAAHMLAPHWWALAALVLAWSAVTGLVMARE